jgi:hypothetical protein
MRRLLLGLLLATLVAVSAGDIGGRAQAADPVVSAQAASVAVPFVETIDDRAVQVQQRADLARWRHAVAVALEQQRAAEEAAAQAAAAEAARAEAARVEAARAAPPPEVQETYERRPGNCGGWEGLISAYFADVATACRVMMCESGGSPTIHNQSSSASGLWQFLDSTWRNVTGTPGPDANYSAETQTAAAAELVASSGWSQWSCY